MKTIHPRLLIPILFLFVATLAAQEIGKTENQRPTYPDEIVPLKGAPFRGKILKFEGNHVYIETTIRRVNKLLVFNVDSLLEINKDFGPMKVSVWKRQEAVRPRKKPENTPRLKLPTLQAYNMVKDTSAARVIENDSIFVGEIDKKDTTRTQSNLVDQTPIPLRKPTTLYPPGAASRGLEGHVKLRLWIDREGTPQKWIVVDCTDSIFVENAVASAMKWEFSPAVVKGAPVGVWAAVTFEFLIQR